MHSCIHNTYVLRPGYHVAEKNEKEHPMFTYTLNVAMASPNLNIEGELLAALEQATEAANGSISARRRHLHWQLGDVTADKKSVSVLLSAPDAVSSPTRALSSLSRALLAAAPQLLAGNTPGNRIFYAEVVDEQRSGKGSLTDGEAAKLAIEVLFEQNGLSPANKKLAKQAAEKVKEALLEYENSRVE